ncbi:MAG TPA: NAD-dependent succinate-semialdehyde dehydrogenase, partial [Acidobacteriota bacterium]|nr:NAD-dependent succinate-semialdehyde dehydrogenase [Acidobacteriota bacterium]
MPFDTRTRAPDRENMAIVTINPATGRKLRSYRAHTARDVDRALTRASKAFEMWRRLSFAQRARHLCAVARELRRNSDACADLITAEMGKPITQARAEVEKCAINCDFFAEHAARFLADERPAGAPEQRYVTYQPLGVVLAIEPWNFPFWQVFRAAAPALMAGNTMVLKHASNVTGCALAIEKLFARAGVPRGVFQTLLIDGARAERLVADERVAMVTLTGSTAVGQRVAARAGAVMKKGVFELGGSDAYVILADADLDLAAELCAESRLYNSGQSCVAAKRFIVVESVRREFEEKLVAALARRQSGDPRDPQTQLGPLAREDLRRELHDQVRRSVRRGARVLLGGEIARGNGYFYPATVLTGIRPGTPAFDEELFGPVAAIISARTEAAAIRLANLTPFGLGAGIFTRDRRRGEWIAREQLDAGNAFVNEFVRSHPSLPFGGVKQSGHGRELGAWGIREFTNVKTISVR